MGRNGVFYDIVGPMSRTASVLFLLVMNTAGCSLKAVGLFFFFFYKTTLVLHSGVSSTWKQRDYVGLGQLPLALMIK